MIMEQLRRETARSAGLRGRFLHYLVVSLFPGVALLTISAITGYPMAFTAGASSCLYDRIMYQCIASSPILIVWDYLFWATATLGPFSLLDVFLSRSS